VAASGCEACRVSALVHGQHSWLSQFYLVVDAVLKCDTCVAMHQCAANTAGWTGAYCVRTLCVPCLVVLLLQVVWAQSDFARRRCM
jgi:hypothetical protein